MEAAGLQYCHTIDFMFPLGGSTPIEQAPIFTNESVEMAIVATPRSGETVVFTGDNLGYIKKVRRIVD